MHGTDAGTRRAPGAGAGGFDTDGVTLVPQALGSDLVAALRRAFDAQAPRARAEGSERDGFWMRSHVWREEPAVAEAIFDSAVGRIVAERLGSSGLWLYEDSMLAKDPWATQGTPWHQDLVSYPLEGRQVATAWVSLDEVDAGTSAVRYLRGSHRWNRRFAVRGFVSGTLLAGERLEPPFEGGGHDAEIAFSTRPGDCVVHHGLILHRAPGNPSPRPRRALALSFCGDDMRFREAAIPWDHPLAARLRAGGSPQAVLPRVLPRAPAGRGGE